MLTTQILCKQKVKFHAPKGEFGNWLSANIPAIHERYWPTSWCFHNFLLTQQSSKFRSITEKLRYHREYIDTPDGGVLSVDWYDPEGEEYVECSGDGCRSIVHDAEYMKKPVALFVPGIVGTSQAEYIRTLALQSLKIGYRVVSMNYRGLGRTPLKTTRLYCAASYDDLETVVKHIRSKNPNTKLIASGFSMGGTVLAGYLAHAGRESLVDAAYLVSVCWDCAAGVANLEKGFINPIINKMLVQHLFKVLKKHVSKFAADTRYDIAAAYHMKTLREFDSNYTIKMFDNYADVDDYYAKCSYRHRTDEIKIPTLCVQAGDDVFAQEADLPSRSQLERNGGKVAMLITARGGHLGFMEGLIPYSDKHRYTFYSDRVYEQYAKALYKLPDRINDQFSC